MNETLAFGFLLAITLCFPWRTFGFSFQEILSPDTRKVILEIGSNSNPISPPSDQSVSVIAFEPLYRIAAAIEQKERSHVIAAAVSNYTGFATLTHYNDRGLSSSLSEVVRNEPWNHQPHREEDGKKFVVPCFSFAEVLRSIPQHIDIWVLKTDIQGLDFSVVSSVGENIKRVPYLITEVSHENTQAYKNVENDICLKWIPHMTKLGYRLHSFIKNHSLVAFSPQSSEVNVQVCPPGVSYPRRYGLLEGDAMWVLEGTIVEPPLFLGLRLWPDTQKIINEAMSNGDFVHHPEILSQTVEQEVLTKTPEEKEIQRQSNYQEPLHFKM